MRVLTKYIVSMIVRCVLLLSFTLIAAHASNGPIEKLVKTNPALQEHLETFLVTREKQSFFYTEYDKHKITLTPTEIIRGTTYLSISEVLQRVTVSFVNDRLSGNADLDKEFEHVDKEVVKNTIEQAKVELIKVYGTIPVFFGDKVNNRTALLFLTQSVLNESAHSRLYKALDKAIVLNADVDLFINLGEELNLDFNEAIKVYLHSVLKLQEITKRKVLLNLENIDLLTPKELRRIGEFFAGPNELGNVVVSGSSEDPKFDTNIKTQDYLSEFYKPIPSLITPVKFGVAVTGNDLSQKLTELGVSYPEGFLKSLRALEEKYSITVPEQTLMELLKSDAITETIRSLKEFPELPSGLEAREALVYLEEAIILAIQVSELKKDKITKVEAKHIHSVLRKRKSLDSSLPFDPTNLQEKIAYKKMLSEKIKHDLEGQDRIVADLVNLYVSVISNPSKNIGTMAMLGPTGTGKTYSTELLAEAAYGTKNAVFEISGTEYQGRSAESELRKLFGAPPSYVGHDSSRGTFVEWMEDEKRGYHGGIIVINEADKADPIFWQYFMEFLDGKGIQKNGGGTPKQKNKMGANEPVLKANNHLVVFTSNQGDKYLYPEELKKLSTEEANKWVENLSQAELRETFVSGGGNSQTRVHESIPERIDVFTAAYLISEETARIIIKRSLAKISKAYFNDFGIELEWEKSVENYFITVFYDKLKGARRIIAAVTNQIEKSLESSLEELQVTGEEAILLDVTQTNTGYKLKVSTRNKTAQTNLEGRNTPDAVKDPEILDRVKNFESRMKEQLFGQEYAVHTISQAARGKMASLTSKGRPLSILMLGASGVGKTEAYRAMAYAWYGSEDRLRIISLEDVQHVEEVFGHINDSYEQHQRMRLFEKALNDNKEGGVILFDEIDKVGGGNPHNIKQFMLKMHSVLEEGVWTSQSGKEYHLGKYTIGFTANFLSQIFDGISRYEAQKSIWEDNRSRDKLTKMLAETYSVQPGMPLIPDSFLKRLDVLLLAEPLAPSDTEKITRKHIEKELGFYEEDLKTKLVISDEFVKDLTKSYYSLSSGAGRSARNILRSQITAYINMARIEIQTRFNEGETDLNIDDLEIELSLKDNLPERAYVSDINWRRKVDLVLTSKINGKVVDQVSHDISKTVPIKRRRPAKQALKTAYHEAGHAVGNVMEKTLYELKLITIFGEDGYHGVNIFDSIKNTEGTNYNWDTAKHKIAMSIAGEKAQTLAGFPEDTGQSGDQESIDRTIRYILVKGKFHDDVKGIQFDQEGRILNGSSKALAKLEFLVTKIYTEANALAEQLLIDNWNLVRDVTALLMKQGDISGEEYMQIKAEHDEKLKAAELQKWIINNDGHAVRLTKDTVWGRFLAKRKKQESPLRNLDPKINYPSALKKEALGSCASSLEEPA